MNRLTIRWKLTLWYGGVLAVVLAGFGVSVYLVMRHQLLSRIDAGLDEELADVMYEVDRAESRDSLHEWLVRRFGRHEGFDFQITDESDERFFANARIVETTLPQPEPAGETNAPAYRIVRLGDDANWRIISVRARGPDGPLVVQVARSLDAFDHESSELLLVLLTTGPAALLVALGGGYFLARRALSPVDRMTAAAARFSADRLDERIVVANRNDELGRLAETLNGMIERLERSFDQMKQFSADAAHELRTPLAVIRSEAEVALRAPHTADEYRHVLESVLEETERLSQMADELLFLSRHDAGIGEQVHEQVELDALLRDAVDHMQILAEEKQVALTLADCPPCRTHGDYHQLRRVVFNLIDNAVKHTPVGGKVNLACEASNGEATVSVSDTGEGISPAHLPHVFKRFYRADRSRSSNGRGTGLGLALCRTIIERHGGEIDILSGESQGTIVRFRLPVGNATVTFGIQPRMQTSHGEHS